METFQYFGDQDLQEGTFRMQSCSRCGNKFECGHEQGKSTCWCFELPHVIPVDEAEHCLCPECLQEKIRQNLKFEQAQKNVTEK